MIIFLKLVSPIIVYLIALGKDIYGDRIKERKGLKNFLLVFMSLALLVSFASTILEHRKSTKERNALKLSNDSLLTITNKLSKDGETNSIILNAKIDELNNKLDPFIRIAMIKYPNKSIQDALASLSQDIGTVKELATRDVYKPISSKDKEAMIASLTVFRGKYKSDLPLVKFYVVQGNANRYKVIVDLMEIFNKSGLKTQLGGTGLYPLHGPQYGIEIHTNSPYVVFSNELFTEIKNYYDIKVGVAVRDSKDWQSKGVFPSGEIQIYVHGLPQFYSNGKVKM